MMKQHGLKTGEQNLLCYRNSLIIVFFLLFAGCQHKPIEQLVFADAAIKAAQKAKADSLAPDLFRKAENYFLRAKTDYEEGYFDSCYKFANEARLAAEQAEYQSLLKQSKAKDQVFDDY